MAWWCEKELIYYYMPESVELDRAKRLWWIQYRDKKIDNLNRMFNLEIDPLWEME